MSPAHRRDELTTAAVSPLRSSDPGTGVSSLAPVPDRWRLLHVVGLFVGSFLADLIRKGRGVGRGKTFGEGLAIDYIRQAEQLVRAPEEQRLPLQPREEACVQTGASRGWGACLATSDGGCRYCGVRAVGEQARITALLDEREQLAAEGFW